MIERHNRDVDPYASARARLLEVINRTQLLVVGFLVVAWISLLIILKAAPEIYGRTLHVPPGDNRSAEPLFVLVISTLILLLCFGAFRRWVWTFWLIAIAFLLGAIRIPVSMLELMNAFQAAGPTWYVTLQAIAGAIQFAIGVAMVAGYKKSGPWGPF